MSTHTARKPKVSSAPETSGFAEASAAFARPSNDTTRFAESLELMRNFGAIDNADARQQILDLAKRLSGNA